MTDSNPNSLAQHRMSRRIRWAETDASGFVHFAFYVRLMEETEYAFLRSRGLNVVLYDDRGTMGFPRLTANIEIINPAIFEQSVTVQLDLRTVDGKRIVYDFTITDSPKPGTTADPQQQVVATGRFIVACCRFPPDTAPYAMLTPEFVIEALLGSTN